MGASSLVSSGERLTEEEVEDAQKISGTDNLTREGWDEDQCRNFLVRVLDWVPRNFNYEDGLRIIHPQLQERFGDENVDLACGVLDELIEVDNYNPFPGSAYQRWKHTHRNRRENLQLPHVPHTTTIMARVVPTRTLLEWRAQNNETWETTRLSPTSSIFKTGISTITHRSAWRIEHTLFVSTGGARATVHHCPSPEEFHRRLWDPDYGRNGNMVKVNTQSLPQALIRIGFTAEAPLKPATIENNATSNRIAGPGKALERKQGKALQVAAAKTAKHRDYCDHAIIPPVGFCNPAYEELSSKRLLPKPGTKLALGSCSPTRNVPLPRDVKIPNAIFARKHDFLPQGVPLPDHIFKGQIQPTAGQLGVAKAEHIFELAESAVVKSDNKGKWLAENNRKEHEESIMKEYFSYFKGPFTADLFYDGGLDFKWFPPSMSSPRPANVADRSPPTLGKRKGFFGRSPAKRIFANASPASDLSLKTSKDSLAAQRKVNRRKQINTVAGNPQLVHRPQDKRGFRDSCFFRAFQRKSFAISPKMEPVPSYPRDLPQPVSPGLGRPNTGITCDSADDKDTGVLRFSGQKFQLSAPGQRDGSGHQLASALPAETTDLQGGRPLSPQAPTNQMFAQKYREKISDSSLRNLSRDFPQTPTRPPRGISKVALSSAKSLLEVSENIRGNTLYENLQPKAFNNTGLPVQFTAARRRQKKVGSELSVMGFDGAADEIHFSASSVVNKADNAQSRSHNKRGDQRDENRRILPPSRLTRSMDSNQNLPHRSAQPPPLQIRKQSVKHLRAATKQRTRNNSSPSRTFTGQSCFPPRTSSIGKAGLSDNPEPSFQSYETGTASSLDNCAQSSTKSQGIVPDNSSAIMGDFVALHAMEDMQDTDTDIALLNVAAKHRYPKPTQNPFEFERSPLLDRLDDEGHLSSFRNFMKEQETRRGPSPRASPHVKNSRSEGNTAWMTQKPVPVVNIATKPTVNTFHRSESSPDVSPGRRPYLQSLSPSQDYLSHYYAEDELSGSPASRGRHNRDDKVRHERRVANDNLPSASSHQSREDYSHRQRSRSPTRRAAQDNLRESFSSSSTYDRASGSTDPRSSTSTKNRHQTRSPTKALAGVFESDELDGRTPRPETHANTQTKTLMGPSGGFEDRTDGLESRLPREAPSYTQPDPPRRARSPMKKMFGENGWLTHSPIIKQESFPEPKPMIHKKPTMMGRIKHKFEEMAEKADMSPMRRSDRDRRPKQTVLARSITPFEQARIYTELELMMVHTANIFLMNQFSEARIAIDTIRKTIDSWKSKGRPMVTEFMYDQTTQRNLVALNQYNFRFHGPGAGDDIRVSSMLYSWKQVANVMAVRTFCDADPVILKLLFDIEHILELLGAGEPFMLRLQEISRGVKDTILLARHKKELEEAKGHSRGQQGALGAVDPSETPPRGRSLSSPYKATKMPDPYHG